ncbi:MAG: GTPase Era [Bacteroidetes bacterium]|nr:GTPase Era [Bacteroidota bacterium]
MLPTHKAGYVNIIGKPNVGKSTLINALIGEKVAITSPKVQTTRHRILGIINTDEYQLIFSDTPGLIEKPSYLLHEKMIGFIKEAIEDADVIFYLSDITDIIENQRGFVEDLLKKELPVYVILNKIDLKTQDEVTAIIAEWGKVVGVEKVVPVSALKKFNMDWLLKIAVSHLPECPPYFDKEFFTTRSERFLAAEVIREKIFYNYKQEIPYSVEVTVTSFLDEPTIIRIAAEIVVNRASQKPILIGAGGEGLKKIGTQARKELEENYGKKVFLEIFVKVREGWRENKNSLRQFGYEG